MSIGTKTFLVATLMAVVAFSGSIGASDGASEELRSVNAGHFID